MCEPVLQQGHRGVVGKGRACGGLYSWPLLKEMA